MSIRGVSQTRSIADYLSGYQAVASIQLVTVSLEVTNANLRFRISGGNILHTSLFLQRSLPMFLVAAVSPLPKCFPGTDQETPRSRRRRLIPLSSRRFRLAFTPTLSNTRFFPITHTPWVPISLLPLASRRWSTLASNSTSGTSC